MSLTPAVVFAHPNHPGPSGTIDREAVAEVINAHLHEVQACYERALVKEPSLSGQIVLEWQITVTGTVRDERTASSTMKRAAGVATCIFEAMKQWDFPPAKGRAVTITYPFIFDAVGH